MINGGTLSRKNLSRAIQIFQRFFSGILSSVLKSSYSIRVGGARTVESV
jgi:hypothetical protein